MSAPRLLFLVTDDRYFVSHRLPMARAARQAGFEIHVATKVTDAAKTIDKDGFTFHALGWDKEARSVLDLLRDAWEIRRLYKDLKPDIVHHVALAPVILGQIAAIGLGIKSINTIAGLGSGYIGRDVKGRLVRLVLSVALRLVLNRKDTLTVIQNEDDRQALVALGIRPQSLKLVPGSGVDIEVLRPLPEPDGPITVGIAARMLDDKGIRPLIDAQQRLQAQGMPIRLLLAGTSDPANRTAIPPKDLAHFATLPGVSWLGQVDDIRELWARCHIAALPSRREGLPKALLEAAAMGRPLIATDVPGCRDVAIHGKTGLLVPLDNTAKLADAIATLAGDAELRRVFGVAARALVEKRFSAEAIGAASVALYQSLTQRPIESIP